MVELSHRERTIKAKIVYYGPPIGGKTTNLQILHQHAIAGRRGDMISVNSAQDRTILFDLLPLRASGFRGFDLRLQILAVPGQAMYAATRRLVLKGADSIVFVANSAADRWEENLQSYREMTQNLITHQLDPASIPLVLQYNKRDLPQVSPIDLMDRALNGRRVDAIPAVAIRGEGVLETFSTILLRTMQDLSSRYQIIDVAKGQSVQQWTQQTVVSLFGTLALAREPQPLPAEEPPPAPAPEPVQPPADRRTVRITMPEDVVVTAGSGPDARANETLVESYAQASAQLSTALNELREQRDLAYRRLDDIHQALSAAHELLQGQPEQPTLRVLLGRMAEAVGAACGSLVRPRSDRSVDVLALWRLGEDPLLRAPTGIRHLAARLLGEPEPHLHLAADSLDLGDALEAREPVFAAVVAAPIRTPRGLQGLALLYYAPDDVQPDADGLAHLATVCRAVSASLELAGAIETTRTAEKELRQALSGTTFSRGIDEILGQILALRERLGEIRRRSDAPAWFLAEFTQLSPHLAQAIGTARSLVGFTRGQIQREPVDLVELAGAFDPSRVRVHVGANVSTVPGDATLLRLGLESLITYLRAGALPSAPPLPLRMSAEHGKLSIAVLADQVEPSAERREVPLALIRRILELHGGSVGWATDDTKRRWMILSLPAS
jgi:signal recognition particle receptor subunit beta